MLDLKLIGGTIVDGSGAPRYRGDVGIKDGKIVALGKVDEPATQTIDATGKMVAPGFVDVHTHYDAQVFWDPTLSPSSYHGITTVFCGFCGFSIAPLSKELGAYLMPMLARVEGMPLDSLRASADWSWTTFADYLSRFEGKLGINAAFSVGHSALRRYVMGPDAVKRRATRVEIDQMKELLRELIRGGAIGFSTTLSVSHNDAEGIPVPSRHASREEVIELYSVISEFEGTSAELLPSIDFSQETYDILADASLAAQRPVNWNALGVANGNPEELKQIEYKLGASDYARERGAEVVALTISQTTTMRVNLVSGMLLDAFDGWDAFFRLPVRERIEKLRDPAYRANMKRQAEARQGTLQNFAKWTNMRVAEIFSERNKRYQGRLITDIAAEEGRDAFDVFADIAVADELKTSFMPQFPEDNPEIYKIRARLINDTRTVVGASDAGAHLDMIHTFSYPTALLESAVRKYKVLTLEQAVHQLTLKPAALMGLRERGQLKQGWHADIVVFDAEAVRPGPIYTRADLPANGARLYADAEGIQNVIVNGREIIRHNAYLGAPAGSVLRPGKDTYTVTIPAARAAGIQSVPQPELRVH